MGRPSPLASSRASLSARVVALDQLQHQRADAVRLLDAVDRTDVWMIEGREQARFTLEPGEAVGIGSERSAAGS